MRISPNHLVTTNLMIMIIVLTFALSACQEERQEPPQASAGVMQLLRDDSMRCSKQYEALRYYDDTLNIYVSNVISANIDRILLDECDGILNEFASRFLHSTKRREPCLARGLSLQDGIRVRLRYARDKNKTEQMRVVKEALYMWERSLDCTLDLSLVQRYRIEVYRELYKKARKLGIKDTRVLGLEEHVRTFGKASYYR